jgi:hypothetical protein
VQRALQQLSRYSEVSKERKRIRMLHRTQIGKKLSSLEQILRQSHEANFGITESPLTRIFLPISREILRVQKGSFRVFPKSCRWSRRPAGLNGTKNDRRTGGCGHRLRVPSANRNPPGLTGA